MNLNIAKEIGNKQGEGTAYGNLGNCYWFLGQYDKAIEHYEMNLNIAQGIGNKQGEGTAYGNLGVCYSSLGQYNKATKYLETGLSIAKNIGHRQGEEIAYGNLGTCYLSLGQYDKAIKYLKMDLHMAKEIGHKRREGTAYGKLGNCYSSLGQYDKAITYLEIGLRIAMEIGHKEGEGTAYGSLGTCYFSLGQYHKAIKYLEMDLNIAKEIGYKRGEGTAYGNLGSCYWAIGQYHKAIEHQQVNLDIAKEIGNRPEEGTAYGNLGVCYSSLRQYDKAIKYLEMNLNIAKEIGHRQVEGTAHGNLGNCYSSLGQYDKAIKYLEMSLNIAKEIEHKQGEGKACGNLGTYYSSIGQYDKAIKYLDTGLSIAMEMGYEEGEGITCVNLGFCCLSLGQYNKAINYMEIGLNFARKQGHKQGEMAAYASLAACCLLRRQYNKAVKHLEMSLIIAKEIEDKEGVVLAYGNLGVCYASLGQYEKAIKNLEMSLDIIKAIGHKEGEHVTYGNLGYIFMLLDQNKKAESLLKKGVECCELLFENLPKRDEDKVSIIDTYISTYKVLVKNLILQAKRDEALVVAEKVRARALTDLMSVTNHDIYASVTETKVSDLYKIRKVVKALGSTVLYFTMPFGDVYTWVIQPNGDVAFRNSSTEELFSSLGLGLSSLIEETIELMTSCGAVKCEDRSLLFLYPEEVLSKPTKKTLETVLASVAPPTHFTVSRPVAAPPRFPRFAPLHKQKFARTTDATGPDGIEAFINHERSNESLLDLLLRFLYSLLLYHVRQYVVDSQAIIVPDGPLALVPFAALVDGNGHSAAESLRVRLVPSLTTAETIRERPEELGNEALVIGDPNVGKLVKGDQIIDVPRLQSAREEVKMVAKLLRAQPLMGKQATKEIFLRKVESASVIHIAAHGDAERGEILLAPPPGTNRKDPVRKEDVMLLISDLEGKRIKAKLVVLSCCYSGRGQVRGEGVVGIARAFLGAGARTVLVTLWAVDDDATLAFMCGFYQSLWYGKSANEALNEAMKTVRELHEKFQHPRYWAPFVLLGEDVTLQFGTS